MSSMGSMAALSAAARETVAAMAVVVECTRRLVPLAKNTIDLDAVGALVQIVARVHHHLDEQREKWEQRAKQRASRR